MASNPIQRKTRQFFLIGFLTALVIMAIVVVLLFMKINALNEEIEDLSITTYTVYTAYSDIKSGEEITGDMLVAQTVRSELNLSYYVTSSYFYETDDEGNEYTFYSKIDIEAGTLLTTDMISASATSTDDDERIIEYNMIVLPSQLEAGDYIDIRLSLPDGTDYIVLSKKYIEQTTTTGIWMKMSESDILTLNCAAVESYMITGSRLYAVIYTDAGQQEEAAVTYVPSSSVITIMNSDSNIADEAIFALAEAYTNANNASARSTIDSYTSSLTDDEKASSVESGYSTENEYISAARDEYISALESY